mmetsp:Transcript_14732/g.19586  ORF Transcript_14732/g.19586 Transcript_14732/m.19586 type:complete len:346 (-) Transcript_14732:451-1488(-)|eukprot:CAMPEP_0197290840 /NCGR_PEP_ID=MMETSP0890-20130614/10253_1 /TAXON_ID=44058 ORGANISM="Aureoumbra lagunensis, Strain CCMP1510" /NCGR_SAMPLE_ID=MMETSP0890 /ASSEMBLY_ACC=CAM_ASM_000533 /LENGTH=345 /DNA_ID=CAMNT_0042763171 /DNA_START=63 /DNA_END=1100 /DNA_ORIENTATION=-
MGDSLVVEEEPLVVDSIAQNRQATPPLRRNRIFMLSGALLFFGTILGMIVATLRTGNSVNNVKTIALSTLTKTEAIKDEAGVGYWLNKVLDIYGHSNSSFYCESAFGAFCGITTCTLVENHGFSACPCVKVKGVQVAINAPYLMASGSKEYLNILKDMAVYGKEAVAERMCNMVENQRVFPELGIVKPEIISFPMIVDSWWNSNPVDECPMEEYKQYSYCGGAPCFYTGKQNDERGDYCQEMNEITCLCGNVPSTFNDAEGGFFIQPLQVCAGGDFSCDTFSKGTTGECILQGPPSFIPSAKHYDKDIHSWAEGVLDEITEIDYSTDLTPSSSCAAYQYIGEKSS